MALPAIIAGATRAAGMAAEMGGASEAASSIAKVGGEIGQVGQMAQQATPKVHMLGQMFGKATGTMTEALTLWVGAMKAAAAPVEQLVRISNPARADAFVRALNDAYGVIGRLLTPVMDAFTRSARKLGDFIAGLEPVFAPAVNAIADLIEHFVDKFVETYRKNAPVFELLTDVVVKFATAVSKVVDVVFAGIAKFLEVANAIARFLGFDGGSFNQKASAVGAAHREARFVGPKQISDDAIKSSLMQGIGAKQTPTENKLDKIHGTLSDFYEAARQKWGQVTKAAERTVKYGAVGAAASVGEAAGQSDNGGSLIRFGMAKAGRK